MNTRAERNLSEVICQESVPSVSTELWDKYQALKKEHNRGTASWRKEWEVKKYDAGDIRKGKPLKEGAIFYRHIPCLCEYGTSNLPRTHREHKCEKVSGGLVVAMQQVTCRYSMNTNVHLNASCMMTGKGLCCSSR